MFKFFSNLIDRYVNWSLWREVKKRSKPFDQVVRIIDENKLPSLMNLIADSLRSGRSAGIILLTDNKKAFNYVQKSVKGLNTVFFREPYKFKVNTLFDSIKQNADVSKVVFAMDGYENDTPFYIVKVPKSQRLNGQPRGCHKKQYNKHHKTNKTNKE
jgi:hypothetical protein